MTTKINKEISFWAMRHGPTTWNIERRIQGDVETDIAADGIDSYFKSMRVDQISLPDVIVISELKRTEQTAQALMLYQHWSKIPLYKEARFNERKWGIFEGLPIKDALSRFHNDPGIRKKYPNIKDWDEGSFKVSGGESIDEVAFRVRSGLRDVYKKYKGKRILFILHAGVLLSLGLDYHKLNKGKIAFNGKLLIDTT